MFTFFDPHTATALFSPSNTQFTLLFTPDNLNLVAALVIGLSCASCAASNAADVPPVSLDAQAVDVPASPSPDTAQDRDAAEVETTTPQVCVPGEATCLDVETRRVCAPDGDVHVVQVCSPETVCREGACQAPVCGPDDPVRCEAGARMVCGSLGLERVPVPCPGGTGCRDGQCVPLQPNVVLVVDTSGSMSLIPGPDSQSAVSAADCAGDDCPPWTFPQCDDPHTPQTRLGRVKQALSALLTTEAAQAARLALAHFPQTEAKNPTCETGYYRWRLGMTGDKGAHEAGPGWFFPNLSEVLAHPLGDGEPASSHAALRAWVDFTESVTTTGFPCQTNADCSPPVCVDGTCQVHADPELRGDGPTPLGRTLFYVGEYLRTLVLVEGRVCSDDAACGSPHHTCVLGRCRDPFAACRPTSIVLFTDGVESVDDDPQTFFHPRVQAKRFRYGLECQADSQCVGGATCVDEQCHLPVLDTVPMQTCNVVVAACQSDAECPPFQCSLDAQCPGRCEPGRVDYVEGFGNNVLRGHEGQGLSVTVHVVDASGGASSSELIAVNGGGAYFTADLGDVQALADVLAGLVDLKSAPACGTDPPP